MVNWLLPVAMFPKTFTNFFFENMAQIAFPIFLIFVLVKLYLQPALVNELVPERRTLQIQSPQNRFEQRVRRGLQCTYDQILQSPK